MHLDLIFMELAYNGEFDIPSFILNIFESTYHLSLSFLHFKLF